MQLPEPLHRWDLTIRQAIDKQVELAGRVLHAPLAGPVRWIAGLDVSMTDGGKSLVAGVVLWDRATGEVVERVCARRQTTFPYVPGLLTFREAPAVLEAMSKLERRPDAVMADGQGIAHPRRLGFAAHVGLFLDLPTVGCAKSRLIGEHDEPGRSKGSWAPLMHKGQEIGRVVRTRDHVKPLYISVGQRITIDEAVALVLDCCTRYRLPEPTRLAHQYVTTLRRQLA